MQTLDMASGKSVADSVSKAARAGCRSQMWSDVNWLPTKNDFNKLMGRKLSPTRFATILV